MLFMSLVILKHGEQRDWLARMFIIKAPTFKRMITKFMDILVDSIYEIYLESWAEERSLQKLIRHSPTFSYFPCARYATDITFQLSIRPSRSIREDSFQISGNHKAYRYKEDVSVTRSGLSVGCNQHYSRSMAEIDIMQENLE